MGCFFLPVCFLRGGFKEQDRRRIAVEDAFQDALVPVGIVANFLDQAVWELPILIEIFDLLGGQADLPIIPDR